MRPFCVLAAIESNFAIEVLAACARTESNSVSLVEAALSDGALDGRLLEVAERVAVVARPLRNAACVIGFGSPVSRLRMWTSGPSPQRRS